MKEILVFVHCSEFMGIDLSRVVCTDFSVDNQLPPQKSIPQIRMGVLEKLLHSTVIENL